MKMFFMKWSPVFVLIIVFVAGGCSSQLGYGKTEGAEDNSTTEDQEILSTKESSWDGVLLENGHFSDSVSGWEVPYGRLVHSFEHFYSPPGGGILITNDASGSLGFRANIGQCIDLRIFLDHAAVITEDISMVVEAAVKTDLNITEASLNGIFVDDYRCGTGHVGSFESVDITGNKDYMIVMSSSQVPDDAKSLHIFISALGADETARLYIDDVILYSPEVDSPN